MQKSPGSAPLSSLHRLAPMFGLEEIRIGIHPLRDAERARIGVVSVEQWWFVEIDPSFYPQILLACADIRGVEFRGKTSLSAIKAVLATSAEAAVLEIESDPIAGVMNSMALFACSGVDSLDGIGYRLAFETSNLGGQLYFDNPSLKHLVQLEAALLGLGNRVATSSGNKDLLAAARIWASYVCEQNPSAFPGT
jgi:hypothetical protein